MERGTGAGGDSCCLGILVQSLRESLSDEDMSTHILKTDMITYPPECAKGGLSDPETAGPPGYGPEGWRCGKDSRRKESQKSRRHE